MDANIDYTWMEENVKAIQWKNTTLIFNWDEKKMNMLLWNVTNLTAKSLCILEIRCG